MKEATKRCFDLLHKKMLESAEYRTGYKFGCSVRTLLQEMTTEGLRGKRQLYLARHTPFAAGVARVILEVIWEREGEKVAA